MITRNKNTLKQFALWIFVGIFATTIFLGISIYFTDDVGETYHTNDVGEAYYIDDVNDVYFVGLFTALGLALLLAGLLSIMMIKNYVSRGQTRRTFFKESSILTAVISVYALILINIFGWLLDLVPGLSGQILTTDYTENFIMLNLVAFISVILFYYLGMLIMFSFKKNVFLGIVVSFVLGSVVGYMEFFSGNTEYLMTKFVTYTVATLVFGLINYQTVKTATVKV